MTYNGWYAINTNKQNKQIRRTPCESAPGIKVMIGRNGQGDLSLNPWRTFFFFCILHTTNILGKGMNPTFLPPAIGKP